MCLTSQPLGNAGGYSYLYAIKQKLLPAALKYQRSEYGKKIRKDYESGKTVQKDNYIVVGAAMRGRYNAEGKVEQQIELRSDEISNAITTVQKDSLICEFTENKKIE